VFCEEGATFKPPTVSGDFLRTRFVQFALHGSPCVICRYFRGSVAMQNKRWQRWLQIPSSFQEGCTTLWTIVAKAKYIWSRGPPVSQLLADKGYATAQRIFPFVVALVLPYRSSSVLNGDRASLHSPFLATKLRKSRQTFLEHLIETYFPKEKD